MRNLLKELVASAAIFFYLAGYGIRAVATAPFRWAWRAILGMTTWMAGPEAGPFLATMFLLLAALLAASVGVGLATCLLEA